MPSRLLIMSCGAKKRPIASPAVELYVGSAYKVLRNSRPAGLPILILSAEHGLIPADKVLEPYDRYMDPARADQFCTKSYADQARELAAAQPGFPFDEVFVHGGRTYQSVIRYYADLAVFGMRAAPRGMMAKKPRMRYTEGRIGEQLSQLKAFLIECQSPAPSLWGKRK